MIEMLEAHWLLALSALILGLLVAWYVFHATRRTRVSGDRRDVLDDGAAPAERNRALMEAAPVVPVVTPAGVAGAGAAVAAAAEDAQAGTHRADDDLARIKGVGPKLVTRLHELGIARFDQIADWDDAEIDRIDAQLGRFAGRIRRDDWVGQAKLLAADDDSGFARKYGNLG